MEVLPGVGQWNKDLVFSNSRVGFLHPHLRWFGLLQLLPPSKAAQSLVREPGDHDYWKGLEK